MQKVLVYAPIGHTLGPPEITLPAYALVRALVRPAYWRIPAEHRHVNI